MSKKLIIAIIQDQDSKFLGDLLSEKGVRFTQLATKGGFLEAKNTTFMIGVDDDKVDYVLNLMKEKIHTREKLVTHSFGIDADNIMPSKVEVGGATVFVVPVDQFLNF